MFFSLSKICWFICAPSHLYYWSSIAAAMLLLTGHRPSGRSFAITAAALLIFIGICPSYVWLLRPLEYRYGAPTQMPSHVDGILTLGGYDSPDRLIATYMLAKQYPDARVVYSGGSGALIDNQPNVDAQNAKSFLIALGLDPRRLTLEGRSRNTWENLVLTQKIVAPKPSEVWLLTISAMQMPRAIEISNRLHWKLIPWPTNHISEQAGGGDYFDIAYNMGSFDNGVREWIGLYAYRWSGKSAAKPN